MWNTLTVVICLLPYVPANSEQAIEKMESVFSALNNAVAERKILNTIGNSPLEAVIRDVNNNSLENLLNRAQKQFAQ